MNNESEISRKLREYDDAFDFYMDRGQMPETVPPDDLLGGFLKQTIDENPQLESQDPVWKELLKEEVMKFLEAMLELFQPIEKAYQREKEYMVVFADADIDQKRNMWGEVYGTITKEYAPEEVNIDGYVEQMKSQDLDAVFASLLSDWDKACDELVRKKKVEIIEFNREKWERVSRNMEMPTSKSVRK